MTLQLRLYIVSGAPNSLAARANLAAILGGMDSDSYSLEVVDCVADPHRALADGVFVTPTLVRVAPKPEQVVVGSLSDRERVIAALGLDQVTAGAGQDE